MVNQVMKESGVIISGDTTFKELREWLMHTKQAQRSYYIVGNAEGEFKGIIDRNAIFNMHHSPDLALENFITKTNIAVREKDTLKSAAETMAIENVDVLPVVSAANNKLKGILSYKDILSAYRRRIDEHHETVAISLKRRTLKMVIKGKKTISVLKGGVRS